MYHRCPFEIFNETGKAPSPASRFASGQFMENGLKMYCFLCARVISRVHFVEYPWLNISQLLGRRSLFPRIKLRRIEEANRFRSCIFTTPVRSKASDHIQVVVYPQVWLSVFKAMLGEVNAFDVLYEDSVYRDVARFLLVLYLIVVAVMLLNLLIAVLR